MAAASGESMAETRARLTPDVQLLKPHLQYSDVWTDPMKAGRAPDPALTIDYSGLTTPSPLKSDGSIVIDYPTHIAPLWTKNRGASTCTNCHNDNDRRNPVSAGLDLRDTVSGTGRMTSYEELMVGDPVLDANGQPVLVANNDEIEIQREEPQVQPGSARGSHLIEVLFHQELRAGRALGPTNHAAMLNASEKRLVAEWIDLGGQYYNSPTDGSGKLRGVTGLSRSTFDASVHPILLNRCGSCHRAVGSDPTAPPPSFSGQRYVLTGQAEGDFHVTLTLINNVCDAANTPLLRRPTSSGTNPVHPQVGTPAAPVLTAGEADYSTIFNWINAGCTP
jgi:hypothetical protein